MFTLERGNSSKNRSVGLEGVHDKEVFTNAGFTVKGVKEVKGLKK
jgi:hypothetical protein